ncbi:MAG: hypothetical protein LH679_17115 [Cyanobacteria bacterium CAN_BIN43]|nr:hypothetical protein [Cyanobacteria bacterium CAN_BIN43]
MRQLKSDLLYNSTTLLDRGRAILFWHQRSQNRTVNDPSLLTLSEELPTDVQPID